VFAQVELGKGSFGTRGGYATSSLVDGNALLRHCVCHPANSRHAADRYKPVDGWRDMPDSLIYRPQDTASKAAKQSPTTWPTLSRLRK